jgi:precorrin isomerase
VIGFIDPEADRIAHINNQREKQFGLSPKDEEVLKRVVHATAMQARVVRTTKVA